MSEPIVDHDLKNSKWSKKKWAAFFCVWYLLSPKIGTYIFWYSVKSDNYTIAVTNVYGANIQQEGDILVCVDLTNPNDLITQHRVGIILPVSSYLDGKNADLNAWINSVAPSVTDSFAIPIEPIGESCDGSSGDLGIEKWKRIRPGSAAMDWSQYDLDQNKQGNILILDVASENDFKFDNTRGRTFGYLSRNINRRIFEMEYAGSTSNGDPIKKKVVREEHYLEFYFPLKQTGVRWKNIGLIRYVFYDIISGPLAWLGIFTPIFTGSRA
jgi:hypothetical protein